MNRLAVIYLNVLFKGSLFSASSSGLSFALFGDPHKIMGEVSMIFTSAFGEFDSISQEKFEYLKTARISNIYKQLESYPIVEGLRKMFSIFHPTIASAWRQLEILQSTSLVDIKEFK